MRLNYFQAEKILREDIFVAAARKELEYIIKATYSNLVSFNTLVLLLNSIFVKN